MQVLYLLVFSMVCFYSSAIERLVRPLQFDLGGMRNMVISGLRIDRDSYTIIENRRNELSKIEEQIKTEQQKIQADKTTLVQTEEAIAKREEELKLKEQELTNQESLLSGKQTDLQRSSSCTKPWIRQQRRA
jgi:uncharacterized FlgJ-related protein